MAEPAPTSASASPSSTTINIRETPAVVQWTAQVSDDQALAASDADAKDAQVLRSLTMLANTTAIAVQFAHEALPMSGLMALVCAASAKNALKSSLNHGDLSQLYGGQGGKVLEEGFQDWPVPSAEGENEMAAPEASAGSPPSYDGLYSNPTSSPRPAQSLKRPRAYSGCFDGDADRPDVLSICKKLVVEHMAHLRGELRDELRDELRGELRDEIRGEIKTQIEEQNKGLIERVDRRVDEQIAQLRDDVTWQVDKTEERMDEVERHMDNLIDEGIEDRVLGVKLEMQEYVKDEMAEVEDKIIKHFEDGRVTLQFER
ncbi:hypothetical protein SLS53_008490 [Cytospora paraplurivora]|uniref:Uncharacterized protein n=1 Tax=Cytospora paraplurivora TaxID=2898453 RepID=A0AAN9U713_9PEZI